MIRSQFKTYQKSVPPLAPDTDTQNELKYGSDNFLAGLFTDADPASIPDNALAIIQNGRYIKNQLFRRNGLRIYSNTKPDSNLVLNIFAYFNTTDGAFLLRFTKSSIYKATSTGWTHITGPALNGSDTQRFHFTVADERLFSTNDGADVIQEIDVGANTYAPLGNAPRYRYITAAFNRIIGAYRKDTADAPVEIGWSGDLNYSEWDPSVDISAGNTPLVDSPSDLSDVLTGIFSLESCICICRERSIWLGTNQPSSTNPFYFFSSVPRIGADCSNTIQASKDSVLFYSYKDSTVYEYTPDPAAGEGNGKTVDLSLKVKRAIKNNIVQSNANPQAIFASLNYDTNIYTLFIPNATASSVTAYSYNRDTKAWSTETYSNISCCNDVDFANSTITIDDLTGTIAALTGTIDELGGLAANSNRFFGATNGDIFTQPFFAGFIEEVGNIELTDNGAPVDYLVQSKELNSLPYRQQAKYLLLVVTPYTSGNITVSYEKNLDGTIVPYKTVNIPASKIGKQVVILCRKNISCGSFSWLVESTDCMFTLDSFNAAADKGGIFQ